MKESDIEKAVCRYARDTYGMITMKQNSGGGAPDRVFITQEALHVWVEFKSATGKPTALQTIYLNKLVEHGCLAFVCADIEKGKRLVDLISNKSIALEFWERHKKPPGPAPVPGASSPAHDGSSAVNAVDGDESGQNSGDPDKYH